MVQMMKSMELSDEDKLDASMPIPMDDKPDFPYGLRICLTHEEMAKLDIDPADAFVGGTFHLFAMARVTSISMSDGEYGPCCRLEAQIEEMAVESEDAENGAMENAEDKG